MWSCVYSRAPPPPQIEHDDPTSSVVDVDSPHVSSVPSDYSGETDTSVKRKEKEAEDAAREAEQAFEEISENVSKDFERGKKEVIREGKEAKAKAKEADHHLNRNRDNPVVVGNAVVIGVGTAVLG